MTFSKETLQASAQQLTEEVALQWISLAGSKRELTTLLNGLGRNFGVEIPKETWTTIDRASKRFYQVSKHHLISYAHAA